MLPEELTAISDEHNTHVQIIGNDGHGKTTALMGLTAYFSRKGKRFAYEYLPVGQSKYNTDIQNLEIFLLDEFQRLSERQRVSLIASASVVPIGGLQLIVSSHEDFVNYFKACDLSLTTIRLGKIFALRLRIILERRLRFFTLDETANPSFTIGAVQYLWNTYGGDLHSVEHLLYHVFQKLKPCEKITERHLQNIGPLINHDGAMMKGWLCLGSFAMGISIETSNSQMIFM